MSRTNILSGTAQALATQVNVNMLGGIEVNGQGAYESIANTASPSVADSNTQLSSSLLTGGGATGNTIIKALNVLGKLSGDAAPAGVSGSVQIKNSSTSFGFANGFRLNGANLQVPGVLGSIGSGANVFSGSINAAGLTSSAGVQGTVGTFSSNLYAGGFAMAAGLTSSEGLVLTKDMSATAGNFSLAVSAAGLTSSAGVQGTEGTFSSNLYAGGFAMAAGLTSSEGLVLAKDIQATAGNFSLAVSAAGLTSSQGLVLQKDLVATAGNFVLAVSAAGLTSSEGLVLTKDMSATAGNFSLAVSAAGLTSSAGVQGTEGTFSSNLVALGLTSSAGLRVATTVQAAGNVTINNDFIARGGALNGAMAEALPAYIFFGQDEGGLARTYRLAVSGGMLQAQVYTGAM